MTQVPFYKISSTEYMLLSEEDLIAYKIETKDCGTPTTLFEGVVPTVTPTEISLEKDKLYTFSFYEGDILVYSTTIHTYESLEQVFIRKFQKYVCGCGCNGNCDEDNKEELVELFTIGYNLLGISLNIPSVESGVAEALNCDMVRFLNQATQINILYGGDITKEKDAYIALTRLFLILFLKEYVISDVESVPLTKWRIEQLKDCLEKFGCLSVNSLIEKEYPFPFAGPCLPIEATCDINPITLAFEEMIKLNEYGGKSFSDRLILFKNYLSAGIILPRLENCCVDCEGLPLYMLVGKTLLNTVNYASNCCRTEITRSAPLADPTYLTTCDHIVETDLEDFFAFMEYDPSTISELVEINFIEEDGVKDTLLREVYWTELFATFFGGITSANKEIFFKEIEKVGIGFSCTTEDGRPVVLVGDFNAVDAIPR